MALQRRVGNILDATEDALIVAVDGDHPRMMGAIGHKLAKRIADADEWDNIVSDASFPLAPADARLVALDDSVDVVRFRHVIFASMFNHHDNRLYLDVALQNALTLARTAGLRTVATALYRGGWRGTPEQGMAALTRACERVPGIDVTLYELAAPTTHLG